ncbi:MAG: hypothetical protein AB1757_20305 [Acidobacteriota bacterium]
MPSKNDIKNALAWIMISTSLGLMVYNTVLYSKTRTIPEKPKPEIPNGTNLSGLQLKRPNGESFVIPATGKCLIAFLTVGCGACEQQVEPLNQVVEAKPYVKVLGVFSESANKVASFELSSAPKFIYLMDYEGQLRGQINLTTFPQTVEINDGFVTRSWVGLQKSFD